MYILKKLMLILALVFVSSCGDQTEEEIDRGIYSAISDLTSGSCQRAIDTLNEIGYQNTNIRYLKTYASAYACRAGYSTAKFFSDDLPLIGSPSTLGSLTRFSTSSAMDQPREGSYRDIQKAIDALLYAGGIPLNVDPTIGERERVFSKAQLKDAHAQLMYLLFVQFGKFLYYYGNSSTSGVKGSGPGSYSCLANYDQTIPVSTDTFGDIGGVLSFTGPAPDFERLTGNCDENSDGHPDMGADGNLNTSRLCEGLVLFNNLLVIIPEVLASTTGTDLAGAQNLVNDLQAALNFADDGDLEARGVLSQKACEETYTSNNNKLQVFYVLVMETLFE